MNYTILYKNGTLLSSKPIPVYQNDLMSNQFKILVDLNCLEDFIPEQIQCDMYYRIPGNNTFYKKKLFFEEELFKDHYLVVSTAISREFTGIAGDLDMFLNIYDESKSRITNTIKIVITPSNFQYDGGASSETVRVYYGVSAEYPESLDGLEHEDVELSTLTDGYEHVFATNNEHVIFAYPKERGELKKITDGTGVFELQDGFEVLEIDGCYCYVEQNLTTDEGNSYIFYMEA